MLARHWKKQLRCGLIMSRMTIEKFRERQRSNGARDKQVPCNSLGINDRNIASCEKLEYMNKTLEYMNTSRQFNRTITFLF
jgi:hypothetical protein